MIGYGDDGCERDRCPEQIGQREQLPVVALARAEFAGALIAFHLVQLVFSAW